MFKEEDEKDEEEILLKCNVRQPFNVWTLADHCALLTDSLSYIKSLKWGANF